MYICRYLYLIDENKVMEHSTHEGIIEAGIIYRSQKNDYGNHSQCHRTKKIKQSCKVCTLKFYKEFAESLAIRVNNTCIHTRTIMFSIFRFAFAQEDGGDTEKEKRKYYCAGLSVNHDYIIFSRFHKPGSSKSLSLFTPQGLKPGMQPMHKRKEY